VDGAINPTTTHQARIGGVDNGISGLSGDITLNQDNCCLINDNFPDRITRVFLTQNTTPHPAWSGR
jgi:hypothetical protein